SRQGGPSDNVIAGINAVAEHSLAIGQSHVYASEVLRSFAHLETALVAPGSTYPPSMAYQPMLPSAQAAAIGAAPYAPGNGHTTIASPVSAPPVGPPVSGPPVSAPPVSVPPAPVPAPAPTVAVAAPAAGAADADAVRSVLLQIVSEK